ncbi:hypothetical protein [uncultured Selenomonas sp.]|uniref:hypothetical protein n=1 Tax=uncultured Selenomonas sp. TaxID=159275 RepID=UPI002609010D|nr:hypothetical protein [uncultured Selenomonas sp.]
MSEKKAEEKKDVKKEAATESMVAKEKAAKLQAYLVQEKISGIEMHKAEDAVHSHVFRSNLPLRGQDLPFMILVDDSVYTLIQIEIAARIVTAEKKPAVTSYLDGLNNEYRMLKYNSDEAGNLLLTCCIPSGVEQFDPSLIVALVNQIQGHLEAVYPDIMKHLWADGAAEKKG